LKYESEIFIKSGAWKSLEDLEANLTLEELFLLYRASMAEVSTDLKIAAAAQGADVDFEEDWYEPEEKTQPVIQPHDLVSMPIGLGYSIANS
jgi:hypothetical protein